MTSNPFLDTIPFLTPEDRAALHTARYDNLDALLGTTQAALVADVKLPSGLAAQLVRWAHSREEVSPVDDVGIFLNLLGGPRHASAVRELHARGVERCCVGEDGRVSADHADFALDEYPEVAFYKGSRVVRIEDVGAARLHHPKTGLALTRGDAVPWITLGRDALVVAAAVFDQDDILAGEGDRAVFNDAKALGSMHIAARARLAHDRALKARCEALVDGTGLHEPLVAADAVAKLHKAPERPRGRTFEEVRRWVLEVAEPVLVGAESQVVLELLREVRPNQVSTRTRVYARWDYDLEPNLCADVVRSAQDLGLDAEERAYRGSGSSVTLKGPK